MSMVKFHLSRFPLTMIKLCLCLMKSIILKDVTLILS